MRAHEADLLAVLKAELKFLENGGYRKLTWHPQFIFEDSPTCLNNRDLEKLHPCSECALAKFVPPESREASTPCRHIQLNEKGETLETLYRWASQEELEASVSRWLKATIQKLEQDESQDPERQAGDENKITARSASR